MSFTILRAMVGGTSFCCSYYDFQLMIQEVAAFKFREASPSTKKQGWSQMTDVEEDVQGRFIKGAEQKEVLKHIRLNMAVQMPD